MTERPPATSSKPSRVVIDLALGLVAGTAFYVPVFESVFLPLGSWIFAVPAVIGLIAGPFSRSATSASTGFLLACIPPMLLTGTQWDSAFLAVCGVMVVPFSCGAMLSQWLAARSRGTRGQRNTPGSGGATSG